jgi:hypothetical protein
MKTSSLFVVAATAALFPVASLQAAVVSHNTGSLGAAAHGSHDDTVTFGLGAVSAGGDQAAFYGTFTSVPH